MDNIADHKVVLGRTRDGMTESGHTVVISDPKGDNPVFNEKDAIEAFETIAKNTRKAGGGIIIQTTSMDDYLPQPRGAGRSYVNEAIKSLSDDEVVRCFTNARMSDKVVFLQEIQKRGIKSITVDLEGDMTEEKLMEVMETGALFLGEPADYSHIEMMFKEETCMMERFQKKVVILDSMSFPKKQDIYSHKKKEPKFYQELNKNSRGKYRS